MLKTSKALEKQRNEIFSWSRANGSLGTCTVEIVILDKRWFLIFNLDFNGFKFVLLPASFFGRFYHLLLPTTCFKKLLILLDERNKVYECNLQVLYSKSMEVASLVKVSGSHHSAEEYSSIILTTQPHHNHHNHNHTTTTTAMNYHHNITRPSPPRPPL